MRARAWMVAPSVLAFVLGCGSSSGGNPTPPAPDAGDLITCQNDPRAMTYAPGLTVTSKPAGSTKYVLLSADPAPPARGTDTWSIRITDPGGTAQTGLSVGVLPFMPDHGHGTSVAASVTANQDGTYTVTPLYFFMPGVWRISFWIGQNQAEVGEFYFCIPG